MTREITRGIANFKTIAIIESPRKTLLIQSSCSGDDKLAECMAVIFQPRHSAVGQRDREVMLVCGRAGREKINDLPVIAFGNAFPRFRPVEKDQDGSVIPWNCHAPLNAPLATWPRKEQGKQLRAKEDIAVAVEKYELGLGRSFHSELYFIGTEPIKAFKFVCGG